MANRCRTIVPAVLLAGLTAWVAAPAGAAGFDCAKYGKAGDHPMESLVCGEPALSRLDDQVSAAYRARRAAGGPAALRRQRQWVEARYDLCGVPTLYYHDAFPPKLRRRFVPCLTDLYRQRLAELEAPAAAPAESAPRFIHPLCLIPLLDGAAKHPAAAVPVEACNRAHAGVLVVGDSSVGYVASDPDGRRDGKGRRWLSYREVGALADGRRLAVVTTRGGPGRETAARLVALALNHGTLALETLLKGGDRCAGGILDATPTPAGIEVRLSVATYGFEAAIAGLGFVPGGLAWDCDATLLGRLPEGGGPLEVLEASLTVPAEQDPDHEDYSPCLRNAIMEAVPDAADGNYPAADFPALHLAFKSCLKTVP